MDTHSCPPLMATGALLNCVVPSPISPVLLKPQQNPVLPVVMPQAVSRPAVTRSHDMPPTTASGVLGAGAGPLPICPAVSSPQHIATASEVTPQEKLSPALTLRHEWSPATSAGRAVLAPPVPSSP